MVKRYGVAAVLWIFLVILCGRAPVASADSLTDLLIKKGTITKEESETLQKRSIASFVDRITLYGDLQLRHETQWYNGDGNDTKNVSRQRFRLRIGSDLQEGAFTVHLRLAGGKGQQTSVNQTMQSLSSGKSIWIDRAYVEYGGIPDTTLQLGRMANPLFRNMTSEILWDEDYNPEGLSEKYALNVGGIKIFATAAQIVLDNKDEPAAQAQWLLGYQAGTEGKIGSTAFNLAVLYYNLANGTKSDFSQVGIQDGNTRANAALCTATAVANCRLVNPYHVLSATGSVSVNAAGIPVTVSADVVKNLADTTQTATIEDENFGYAVGLKLGSAVKARTYELAYLYKFIETDATLADLNDSETGPRGGTNRKGYIVWAAYNITDAAQVKVKYFNTEIKNDDLPPAPIPGDDPNPAHNRIQVDFLIKF